MTNQTETETTKLSEQILNKKIHYIYERVKSIIECDEFGIFNLKAKIRMDKENSKYESAIQTLINDNTKKQNSLQKFRDELSKIESLNEEKVLKLKEKLLI